MINVEQLGMVKKDKYNRHMCRQERQSCHIQGQDKMLQSSKTRSRSSFVASSKKSESLKSRRLQIGISTSVPTSDESLQQQMKQLRSTSRMSPLQWIRQRQTRESARENAVDGRQIHNMGLTWETPVSIHIACPTRSTLPVVLTKSFSRTSRTTCWLRAMEAQAP